MTLLLSNDDGYLSPGLTILAETLSAGHRVFICAPYRQMSATSHAVNIFKPLELFRISPTVCALDGTPADCVKVGLSGIFPEVRFDLVISGINDGPNLGEDVIYSGTVAAAREASLNGYPALACSRDGWNVGKHYEQPSLFIARLLDHFPASLLHTPTILNINFPQTGNCEKYALTSLGKRIYTDDLVYYQEEGREFIRIEGDPPGFHPVPGSDLDAVSQGLVSITPLANAEHDPRISRCLKRSLRHI